MRAHWNQAVLGLRFATLAFLACSCGSSDSGKNDGSGGGASAGCPNLSGAWTITEHCMADLLGKPVVISANGCNLTITSPVAGQTVIATVDQDGALELTVTGGSGAGMVCPGVATSSTISLGCSGCSQTLTKQ
jgi:hypothetical protein